MNVDYGTNQIQSEEKYRVAYATPLLRKVMLIPEDTVLDTGCYSISGSGYFGHPDYCQLGGSESACLAPAT